MPLITEEDYERLAEHLSVIDKLLDGFSSEHGYTRQHWPLSGRYPNRMLYCSQGAIQRSIQITMDNNPDGERFDHFFPEIPYTVFAAAWIEDYPNLTRWHSPSIRLDSIPFTRLVSILPHVLSHFQGYLSGMNEAVIRSFESSSKLSLS
ncbi:MAG: hypothetical protein ACOYOF_22285 [Verrucomicrobiaceae bacterium]|jgi:hypothetical protein